MSRPTARLHNSTKQKGRKTKIVLIMFYCGRKDIYFNIWNLVISRIHFLKFYF